MKTIIFTKIKTIPVILFIFIFLNSCGIYKYSDARKNPTNANERIKKNMEEGKGFRLGGIGQKNGNFDFATSNPLWRASLDILDFAPLNNVDYAGGIIVTDWFVQQNSPDQVKITVKFLSNEIRADGIDVIIYQKICNELNKCKVSRIESGLEKEIKLAILKQAAILEQNERVKNLFQMPIAGS